MSVFNKSILKQFVLYITICYFFSCNDSTRSVSKIESKQISIDNLKQNNTSVDSIITPYKNHINKNLNTPLSYTKFDITKSDGKLESRLGNLIADLCYEQGSPIFNNRYHKTIDFVLLNHGGLRAPISKGKISTRQAFEVMPFENEMVVVELSGEKTKALFDYLLVNKKAHPISRLTLKIKNNGKLFNSIKINGIDFDRTKNYYVLTSDYLQQGGDNMTFFDDPIKLYGLDYKIRNAMIDYLKTKDTISPILDNRFSYDN